MPDDLAPRGFYEGLAARSLMAGWADASSRPGRSPTCASTYGERPRRGPRYRKPVGLWVLTWPSGAISSW